MSIPETPRRGAITLALITTVLVWASAFVVVRSAIPYFPGAGVLALLRFATASVALGIYAFFAKLRRPRLNEIVPIVVAGFLGIAVYHSVFNQAAKAVTAGTSSLFISSAPVFGALIAKPLLGERIGLRRWVGILVAFFGIALLAVGKESGVALEPAALLLVLCAACVATWVLIQKKWLSRLTAAEFTTYGFWVGTLFLLVFTRETVEAVRHAPVQRTLEVIYLGIFPSALAYLTFAFATRHLPASRVMSFMYLQPGVAMVIAWAYLGEIPSVLSLCGGGLALVGVAIVNHKGRRKSENAEADPQGMAGVARSR